MGSTGLMRSSRTWCSSISPIGARRLRAASSPCDLGARSSTPFTTRAGCPATSTSGLKTGAVEITEYLHEYVQDFEGTAPNFHRPLSAYLNLTITLGCDIFEIVEPRLRDEDIESPAQELLTRIPNFIVIGARKHPHAG